MLNKDRYNKFYDQCVLTLIEKYGYSLQILKTDDKARQEIFETAKILTDERMSFIDSESRKINEERASFFFTDEELGISESKNQIVEVVNPADALKHYGKHAIYTVNLADTIELYCVEHKEDYNYEAYVVSEEGYFFYVFENKHGLSAVLMNPLEYVIFCVEHEHDLERIQKVFPEYFKEGKFKPE